MKCLKIGCLTLLSVFCFLMLCWLGCALYYQINYQQIQFDSEEIELLEQYNTNFFARWDEIMTHKQTVDSNYYLNKQDFLLMLDKLGGLDKERDFFSESIPENRIVYFCEGKGFSYEVFSICEPHILYPDCYNHYLSFGVRDDCPLLYEFDNDIQQKKCLSDNVYYTIVRNYW